MPTAPSPRIRIGRYRPRLWEVPIWVMPIRSGQAEGSSNLSALPRLRRIRLNKTAREVILSLPGRSYSSASKLPRATALAPDPTLITGLTTAKCNSALISIKKQEPYLAGCLVFGLQAMGIGDDQGGECTDRRGRRPVGAEHGELNFAQIGQTQLRRKFCQAARNQAA